MPIMGFLHPRVFETKSRVVGKPYIFAVSGHIIKMASRNDVYKISQIQQGRASLTRHIEIRPLRHISGHMPFDMRLNVRRIMPREHHSKSPEELFSKSQIRPTTKYLHPFGCPVFVLNDALQGGNAIPKWEERSRVGVYLGHTSQHAQNVSLILNPRTGYISPQLHCAYND